MGSDFSSYFRLLTYPTILALLMVFFSCGEKEKLVEEVGEKSPKNVIRAKEWADYWLDSLTLQQKIGQLIMVEAPLDPDTASLRQFVSYLNSGYIGGVLLGEGNRELQRKLVYECKSQVQIPLWVALNADRDWARENEHPDLTCLGAIRADSLARGWGEALGEECNFLGAQVAMLACAVVSDSNNYEMDAISSDQDKVRSIGNHLIAGLEAHEIIPCIRALPRWQGYPIDSGLSFPAHGQDPETLKSKLLGPGYAWIRDQIPALQLSHFSLLQLDSTPVSFSEEIQQKLLRHSLNYEGLLFSPPFNDSLFHYGFDAGEGELMALQAGSDMVVAPSDVQKTLLRISDALQSGLFSEKELDRKVHRHLFQKALAGLDTLAYRHPDSFPRPQAQIHTTQQGRKIIAASLSLLRNGPDRLPLKKISKGKFASLSIGSSRKTAFQKSLEKYTSVKHFQLPYHAKTKAYEAKLTSLKKFKYVLVSLEAGLANPDSSGRLPSLTRNLLAELSSTTRTVVLNLSGPEALADLDSLDCLLHAPNPSRLTAELAGQAIFGGIPINGLLPYSIDSAFQVGSGLEKNEKIRLEFADGPALGLSESSLEIVDSIVRSAIYRGTFPGCQVLAVKDGQVFYNRAFGHHDYSRQRRVRLNDVYDIASVTKITATTLMAMWSYDQDSLDLKAPLKSYLKELDSSFISIKDITPEELMIHKAGLPASLPVYKYYTFMDSVDSVRTVLYSSSRDSTHDIQIADHLYFNPAYVDTIWNKSRMVKLKTKGRYVYSDMSMFLMKTLLERLHDTRLDRFVKRRFYEPLGLQTLGYHPLRRFGEDRIVPTENDRWWRKQQLLGHVHDPSTALFGGVGGQAGLFSNAQDLATLMQLLLNEGTYGGTRFISQGTVRKFTGRHPNSHRGLGFDMQKPVPVDGKGMCCTSASAQTFGHTGYTGTCVWADPENQVIFIFLSNRVFPTSKNRKINIYRVRQKVQQALYNALGLGPKEVVADTIREKGDTLSFKEDSANAVMTDSIREFFKSIEEADSNEADSEGHVLGSGFVPMPDIKASDKGVED